jgi:hypothetical protein
MDYFKKKRKNRSSIITISDVSMEKMIMNNNRQQVEDYRFTPKNVLVYCIIVGLISTILSLILIDWLLSLSMAAVILVQLQSRFLNLELFHNYTTISSAHHINSLF